MTKDFNVDLSNLKKELLSDQISLFDAVDQFINLLNDFQNEGDEILLFDSSDFSKINKELLATNNKTKERIKNLNRIIVLQELGIKFDNEEIDILLSK